MPRRQVAQRALLQQLAGHGADGVTPEVLPARQRLQEQRELGHLQGPVEYPHAVGGRLGDGGLDAGVQQVQHGQARLDLADAIDAGGAGAELDARPGQRGNRQLLAERRRQGHDAARQHPTDPAGHGAGRRGLDHLAEQRQLLGGGREGLLPPRPHLRPAVGFERAAQPLDLPPGGGRVLVPQDVEAQVGELHGDLAVAEVLADPLGRRLGGDVFIQDRPGDRVALHQRHALGDAEIQVQPGPQDAGGIPAQLQARDGPETQRAPDVGEDRVVGLEQVQLQRRDAVVLDAQAHLAAEPRVAQPGVALGQGLGAELAEGTGRGAGLALQLLETLYRPARGRPGLALELGESLYGHDGVPFREAIEAIVAPDSTS